MFFKNNIVQHGTTLNNKCLRHGVFGRVRRPAPTACHVASQTWSCIFMLPTQNIFWIIIPIIPISFLTLPIQHSNILHREATIQNSSFNIQHSNILHREATIQNSTFNIQHSKLNIQHSKLNTFIALFSIFFYFCSVEDKNAANKRPCLAPRILWNKRNTNC